jgi:hypothetical protein
MFPPTITFIQELRRKADHHFSFAALGLAKNDEGM